MTARKKNQEKTPPKKDVNLLKPDASETAQTAEELPKKVRKVKLDKLNSKKLHNTLVIIAIVVPTVLIGMYYYVQYINAQNELHKFRQNPQAAAVNDLIKKIERHVDLPQNESPTIATITDADKLKNQPFFANAQNGDKILIYQNSNRTILYRPLTDKIVETLPIKIDNADELTQRSVVNTGHNNESKETTVSMDLKSLDQPVRIAIYNGTRTPGFASRTGSRLNRDFQEFEVETIDIGDAVNSYDKTLVVSMTDLGNLAVNKLSEFLNASIEIKENIVDENPEESDIVIYLGSE